MYNGLFMKVFNLVHKAVFWGCVSLSFMSDEEILKLLCDASKVALVIIPNCLAKLALDTTERGKKVFHLCVEGYASFRPCIYDAI